jgi:ppGpp synthetase/RelA/SpoT-type nucleotidyltranferase
LESFALKIETGRCANPNAIEDYFGCLIVVQSISEIAIALAMITKFCTIEYRRPKSDDVTHKNSDSFPFDDLRLYAKLRAEEFLPEDPLTNIVFEIQVKTFLQHAWSIATHDLIYKSDKISWARERIAYQIKAILEQAEVSISGADKLSELPEVSKENPDFTLLKEVQKLIIDSWDSEDLPADTLRLSRTVFDLLKALGLSVKELEIILAAETGVGKGVKTRDLTPYTIILQSIINQKPDFIKKFDSNTKNRFKIFLPKEVSLGDLVISKAEYFVVLK